MFRIVRVSKTVVATFMDFDDAFEAVNHLADKAGRQDALQLIDSDGYELAFGKDVLDGFEPGERILFGPSVLPWANVRDDEFDGRWAHDFGASRSSGPSNH